MLEVAAADPLVPGSNLRADVVGSSWLLLLPTLRQGLVAFEGEVDGATRAAVARAAATVAPADAAPDGTATLVVVGPGAHHDRVLGWIGPGAAVHHLPGAAPVVPPGVEPTRAALVAGTTPGSSADRSGPSLLAVPFAPTDPVAARRPVARAGRVVARASRRLGYPIGTLPGPERRGVVVDAVPGELEARSGGASLLRTDPHPVDRLPPWLLGLAADAGIDLTGHRFRFLPGGDYWAQKSVFLTFPAGAEEPSLAVKVGRGPLAAARLDVERAALAALAGWAPEHALVPGVAFAARVGDIAVLAQAALPGDPLAESLVDGPRCAATRAAGDALLELATGAIAPRPAAPGEAADAMRGVVARFRAAHPERSDLCPALERAVEAVASSPGPLPVVFHHGDAGVWNLLRTADGRVGLLDWENAEAGGVPLWDLFYLHQTRRSRLAAAAGRRWRPRRFADELLAPTPHRQQLLDDVARWTDALGLDPSLVDPLFRLCWAHHAAKEASRTPPGRARRRGHYLGILEAVVAGPPLR